MSSLDPCFVLSSADAIDSRWLTQEEKKLAIERLRDNQTGIKNTNIKQSQIVEALLDPKTWIFVLFGIASQVVNGAVSNFGTLIVQGFGYSTLSTTLLQIPYGFIILASILSAMYLQRWLPGQQRCFVAGLYVLPALAGVVGIYLLPKHHHGANLACYYVSCSSRLAF